ncbi:hypothetical protein AB1K09_19915 [Solibacillus silvestris]
MTFEEFKAAFIQIAELDGIKVTDEELAKLFIAQLVVNSFENKQAKDALKRKRVNQ